MQPSLVRHGRGSAANLCGMSFARLRPLAFALTLGAALSCPACNSEDAATGRPRNVVLFVVDTLRADRLGCYGYERETSPTIDKLAEAGTLFERNYAQGYWTVPSMISMMSGLYVTDDETALTADAPTMCESLQGAGITTAAFVGNRVLTNSRGFERGLDHFEGPDPSGRAQTLVNRFAKWYTVNKQKLARGKGFFAWIHAFDPHEPYRPKPEFRVFNGPRPGEAKLRKLWEREAERVLKVDPNGEHPSFEEAVAGIREESNLYDGEVLAVDAGVRRLIEVLRKAGELDRTLIIFAADHGETHCEHADYPQSVAARLKNKGQLDRGVRDLLLAGHRGFRDDVWRTPLLMVGPGVPAGVRAEHLTANLDLYPTILDIFDVPAPRHLAGQSLWRSDGPSYARVFGHSFDTQAVIADDGFKLIEHSHARLQKKDEGPRPIELFRPTEDPAEVIDFAGSSGETAEKLRALIHAWQAEYKRSFISETSEEARQTLLDLGYTGY